MNEKKYIKEVKQNAIQCESIIENTIFNTIEWQLDDNDFAKDMSEEEFNQFSHEIAQQIIVNFAIKNIYKTIK
jgi:hypothetical protein